MLTKRVIPCLDVKDGRVVKGVRFVNLKDSGDPASLARRYMDEGADELVFLDISASHERRETMRNWVCAVADELVLAHPGHASNAGIAVILGGPFLYLLGNARFKWTTNRRRTPPASHLAGLALLAALAVPAFGHMFGALTLAWLTSATLVLVATWEWRALQRT